MILTPIDISTRPQSTSTLETSSAGSDSSSKNKTNEFGFVMNNLLVQRASLEKNASVIDAEEVPLLPSDGLTEQALADMLNLTPPLGNAGDGMLLTAIHLGPHLQVITPQTAAPEGQSLEVFARSQGLDEVALQWLMRTSQSSNTVSAVLPVTGISNELTAGVIAGASSGVVAGASAGVAAGVTAGLPTGLPPALVGELAVLNKTLNTQELTPLPSPSLLADQGPIPNNSSGNLKGISNEESKLASTSSEELSQLPTHLGLKPILAQPNGSAAMTPATNASDWLMANTLAVNGVKANNFIKTESSSTSLDLGALLPADMQGTLELMAMDSFASGQESNPQGQGSHNGRTDANLAPRTEAMANPSSLTEQDSAQRRENISTLAEKMGQAVGQRILSELERGQWHLKLSLRPATLGHIEVEMRMRSGEMDAIFTAPQALTRELLNEGMSKLKDTLNQMGMDVASLKVDDGQSRQRGGESTPERQAQLKDNAPTESAEAPMSPTFTATNKMGIDGWDVLV